MKIVLTSDLHRGFNERTWEILDEFFIKLAEQHADIVILAGDLGSNKFDHFHALLKQVRKHLRHEDIVAVRGNHDLWEKQFNDIFSLLEKGQEKFKEYNIHHLEEGPFVKNNVSIHGWDGWYYLSSPPTNDEYYIPGGHCTHQVLTKRAHDQFERVQDELLWYPTHKKVVVTHMPCFDHDGVDNHYNANPLYMTFLEGKCDVLCFGHTHRAFDDTINGIRCLNSGSDYNKPNYVIFEI